MLESQRDAFDMPREVCFLNAAAWSPLPLVSVEAGRIAAARKGRPWEVPAGFDEEQFARARTAAAAMIGADANDIALVSSVGYGVSTAAKILDLPPGSRILVLDQGKLAEAGRHRDLLAADGLYADMWTRQLAEREQESQAAE